MRITSFEPGKILLVRFSFSEGVRSKKRPALVLARSNFRRFTLYTIAMITSAEGLESHKADVRMVNWHDSGLPHASTIRLAKIATIDAELVDKPLGTLGRQDFLAVKKIMRTQMAFWL